MKSLKKMVSLATACAMSLAIIVSCQNDKVESASDNSECTVSLTSMQSFYKDCLKQPMLVPDKETTRAVIESSSSITPLYLERSEPLMPHESIQKEELITFKDVIALQERLGVCISSSRTSITIDSIYVDVEAAEKALDPMVKQSKQWLYSKGMSENEIQTMLAEEGATESELVPFVMGCMEAEGTVATRAISLEKAKHCALMALGFDFVSYLGNSGITTWGKAALKKAFKSVAKKALGPAGAAIALIEFGICMY